MKIKLPSIDKSSGRNDAWGSGPELFVDPSFVMCVEPKFHSYHSFRPVQEYAVLYLSTGATIETMATATRVNELLESAAKSAGYTGTP